MAAEPASFKTVTVSISLGSKRLVGPLYGTLSTMIKGLLVLMPDVGLDPNPVPPLIFHEVLAPGAPELIVTCNPGVAPCNKAPRLDTGRSPKTSFILRVAVAP